MDPFGLGVDSDEQMVFGDTEPYVLPEVPEQVLQNVLFNYAPLGLAVPDAAAAAGGLLHTGLFPGAMPGWDLHAQLFGMPTAPAAAAPPVQGSSEADDGADGGDPTRRRKRLEKNRESARECRKRKKDKISQVEQQAKELEARIEQLQKEYWYTKDKLDDEKAKIVSQLEPLLKAPTRDVQAAITSLLKRFSAVCYKDGQTAICHHFQQIKQLLISAQTVKFILMALSQNDDFHMGAGNSVWMLLAKEMEWTEEQTEFLIKKRGVIRQEQRAISAVIKELDEASAELQQRLNVLHERITTATMPLSPEQKARFVVWVEKNTAAMKLLQTFLHSQQRPAKRQRANPPEDEGEGEAKADAEGDGASAVPAAGM